MAKTKISKEEFGHLEGLSKLRLKKEERDKIRNMLSETLKTVSVLDELNTKDVEALDHPTGSLKNVTREDTVVSSLSQKDALSGAKKSFKGYFVVDSVFEEGNDE